MKNNYVIQKSESKQKMDRTLQKKIKVNHDDDRKVCERPKVDKEMVYCFGKKLLLIL